LVCAAAGKASATTAAASRVFNNARFITRLLSSVEEKALVGHQLTLGTAGSIERELESILRPRQRQLRADQGAHIDAAVRMAAPRDRIAVGRKAPI
jgi:hypothetical protein